MLYEVITDQRPGAAHRRAHRARFGAAGIQVGVPRHRQGRGQRFLPARRQGLRLHGHTQVRQGRRPVGRNNFV